MLVKVAATRQLTTPAYGIEGSTEGFLLRARRVEHARLVPLYARIRRGRGTFDLNAFRDEPRGTELRD